MAEPINIDAILDELGKSIIERAQRELAISRTKRGRRGTYRTKVDTTGNLSRSLRFSIAKRSTGTQLKFYAVGSAAQYADVVEKGRPKGSMPPVTKIEGWMRIKPLKLRSASGKFLKDNDKLRARIAFAIAKKIQEDGTQGVFYFQEAIDAELSVRGQEFVDTISKAITTKINEGWL